LLSLHQATDIFRGLPEASFSTTLCQVAFPVPDWFFVVLM